MSSPRNDRPYLQHLVGPTVTGVVVGIIVLVGQFVTNPIIAHKETQRAELQRAKQEMYLAAVELVNKFYLSIPWKTTDGQATNRQLGIRPTREEINQCLAKLMLVEDDDDVSETFLRCFGLSSERGYSVAFRDAMINQMRRDLYATKPITFKESPFVFSLDDIVDTGPIEASTNR